MHGRLVRVCLSVYELGPKPSPLVLRLYITRVVMKTLERCLEYSLG